MTPELDPELPFRTPREVWNALSSETRTQLMQMEMGEAQARHAAHRSEIASADSQAWGAAHSTVRLLMALNAGAIVAILAFLGSMIEARPTLWISPLVVSLSAFLVGASAAVIASAIAYFAGSTLVVALQGDVLTTKHPYIHGTTESHKLIDRYNALRGWGLAACIFSGVSALVGSVAFLNFAVVALRTP